MADFMLLCMCAYDDGMSNDMWLMIVCLRVFIVVCFYSWKW